jgi:hypothetical protein
MHGSSTHHNVVEDCFLINGTGRVLVESGAHHNVIRRNQITGNMHAISAGRWDSKRDILYTWGKWYSSRGGSDDRFALFVNTGPGNELAFNHMFNAGGGPRFEGSTYDLKVYGNEIHGMVNSAIAILPNRDIYVFDNLFYDGNIMLRLHHVDESTENTRIYVYRNRIYGGAKPFWIFNQNGSDVRGWYYIYHNSIHGSGKGIGFSTNNEPGVPNSIWVNNIFDVSGVSTRNFKMFDYNWTLQGGFGGHNISSGGKRMWNDDPPSFILPANSNARGAGIDLSKPLTIDGKTHRFPGIGENDFPGTTADIGAYGFSGYSDDEDPPTTPTGLIMEVADSRSIVLSWTASTDAETGVKGYEIYRDNDLVGSADFTKFEDVGLKPETTYSYRVLAYDFNNNRSAKSETITVSTLAAGAPVYTVYKTANAVSLDGRLDEFEEADSVQFSPRTGDSDNKVIVRCLWDASYLYLAYEVKDTDIVATVPPGSPVDSAAYSDDSVEWFVDALTDGGGDENPGEVFMLDDDYHGIVSVNNVRYDEVGTDTPSSPDAGQFNGQWEVAVSRTSAGYNVEIRIPWADLGLATPAGDSEIGLSFAYSDKDPSGSAAALWSQDNFKTFRNASLWPIVLLSADLVGQIPNGDKPPAPPKGLEVRASLSVD